jgi:integrase/recombinase XerD
MAKPTASPGNFVTSEENAKSPRTSVYKRIIAQIVRIARREHLDYEAFTYCCRRARRVLDLHKPKQEKTLPRLLSDSDLKRFFKVIQDCGVLQHEIMLKLLFYTAVRVSELVHIRVADVDTAQCKIFIDQGKGSKDRYILFPEGFYLVLRTHLQANPQNKYLFESRHCTPFTPRRVQQIVQTYRARAGITQPVHPHIFRHQMLTYLTRAGLSDAQIQLISGHSSKQALEVYQHLSLEQVGDAYQAAVRDLL